MDCGAASVKCAVIVASHLSHVITFIPLSTHLQLLRNESPTELQESFLDLANKIVMFSAKPFTWSTHPMEIGNAIRIMGEKIARVRRHAGS